MSAYLVIDALVTDPYQFKGYLEVVPKLVEKFGGKYIVIDPEPLTLEGPETHKSCVISIWPNTTKAKEFWYSQEYQQAIELRKGCGKFTVKLVNSLIT
ncbi:DUF1330 domain-containing protein [Paraferrimonas sp. SM1919]|uniref:DUF1330 domain-containing protein n=1 Tax=Paraferrimonas sp. SM1919 TaxID=2662263 RepID=UPI0013D3839D|nr:DUF1330 domain-containing protein [Paraferrimonas sp. SM1919]